MKKIIVLFVIFVSFIVTVDAANNLDVAPKFNTSINNGELNISIYDESGIDFNNVRLYSVDKNKKNSASILPKTSSVSKVLNGKNVQYDFVYDKYYLSKSTNYFHLVVKDNNGLTNDSYFYINKSNGKFKRHFAAKISSLSFNGSKIKFTVEDSGGIKEVSAKDLVSGKNIIITWNNNNKTKRIGSFDSCKVGNDGNCLVQITTSDSKNIAVRTIKYGSVKNSTSGSNNKTSTSNNNNNNSSSVGSNKSTNGATSKSIDDSYVNSSNNVINTTGNVIKVLLVGNSYTYYNDYGGVLAEFAKKTGKKMIVVNAVHGGRDAYCLNNIISISAYMWDNRTSKTSLEKLYKKSGKYSLESFSNSEKKVKQEYNLKLDDAINYDWGGLNRAGKWDYVVLQNHYKGEMATVSAKPGMNITKYCKLKTAGTRKNGKVSCGKSKDCRKKYEKNDRKNDYLQYSNESNVKIYNDVASTINNDTSRFIVMRTFAVDWASHTSSNNYMRKSAEKNGFSFVDTRMLAKAIVGDSKDARLKNFTIRDSSEHPSSRGAYLMATAVYAKIFGKSELASSTSDSNYIKLYNVSGNNFKGAITHALYSKGKATDYAMSVDSNYAKTIQSTVYKNYDKYIKDFSK